HQQEDAGIFPSLRAQRPELAPVMDQLSAQHHRIDPLLERGDAAFTYLAARATEAAAVIAELGALLDEDLAVEEAHVPALLRGARDFPLPRGDEVIAMSAQGFAWASRGIAPEVLARVDAILPPAVTAKLPAARAAFEDRCTRVWGPTTAGAAR